MTGASPIGGPSRAEWRKSAEHYRALATVLRRHAEQRREWGQRVIARQLLKEHIAALESARQCRRRARETKHVG